MRLFPLDEFQKRVFGVFTGYKSFARAEELTKLGFSMDTVYAIIDTLIVSGYLKRNKLGHISVTVEAQRERHGGLTNAEYLEKARRENAKQRQDDWNAAFGARRNG